MSEFNEGLIDTGKDAVTYSIHGAHVRTKQAELLCSPEGFPAAGRNSSPQRQRRRHGSHKHRRVVCRGVHCALPQWRALRLFEPLPALRERRLVGRCGRGSSALNLIKIRYRQYSLDV